MYLLKLQRRGGLCHCIYLCVIASQSQEKDESRRRLQTSVHFTFSCSLLQLLSRTNRNSECVKYAKPPPWPHKDSTILPWQDFARLLLHTFPMLCTLEAHHKTLFLHNTRDIQVLEQTSQARRNCTLHSKCAQLW